MTTQNNIFGNQSKNSIDVLLMGDELSNFEEQLINFCSEATKGRDESHGVEHMSKVRETSKEIFMKLHIEEREKGGNNFLLNSEVFRMVIAAAQFHDIGDHKYHWTDEQQRGLEIVLQKHFSHENSKLIIQIMDAISYSKEKKQRDDLTIPVNFSERLGKVGAIVRDIVSDADKLEAIGKVGIERCQEYTKTFILEKTGKEPTKQELLELLVEHAEEKLLILLHHNYIRTSPGRSMAKLEHNIMLEELCCMLGDNSPIAQRLVQKFSI